VDHVVRQARFPEDASGVLEIWREFVSSPSVSLDYQGYEAEFADLPGKYAPPGGSLLVAEMDGTFTGCVAFRRVSSSICEMKRLYVRPGARGMRVGERLVQQLIADAVDAGYDEMRLDVLEEFKHAQKLYAEFGFAPADPVSFNPLPGTAFLGLRLR
jgi:GNAT superfamily N-acetyltransferase